MKASEIAQYLSLPLQGADLEVDGYADLDTVAPHKLVFAKKYTSELATKLAGEGFLAIVTGEYRGQLQCSHIVSPNPRLDYIRTLSQFFAPPKPAVGIHPTAVVETGAVIGNNVSIGAHSFISSRATIGDGCIIHPNVTIDNEVVVGRNCEIKSGAVIGQEGFGFERADNGEPLHFPHFGNVVIGDNVFIGSNTTVERAALSSTRIDDNVKIDDLVQIGHNSHIGRNSMITVGAIICGGAVLEENSYIAPNANIKEKVVVGRESLVGLGAVVLKDVEAGRVVAGNPAKVLR